jgi:hypothetical protein
MTTALAALAIILPLAVLIAWHLERREHTAHIQRLFDSHQAERQAWLTECRETRAANDREREMWVNERTLLLNRIKPDSPQPMMTTGPLMAPPAVSMDSDEEYWKSKDELADSEWQRELSER